MGSALEKFFDWADKALSRGNIAGPLHGVPMTVKDSFDTAGLISTGLLIMIGLLGHRAEMAAVMPVRRTLGVRTVFNLLGPLVNPARPPRQLVGVYDPAWCVPVAGPVGLVAAPP